jgi:hypothetical protein
MAAVRTTGPPDAYPGRPARLARRATPIRLTDSCGNTNSPAWTMPAGSCFPPGPVYPPDANSFELRCARSAVMSAPPALTVTPMCVPCSRSISPL